MVDLATLDRLKSLFDALYWPVRSTGGSTSELFSSFVALLDELDVDGRELLLTITQDFLRHTLELYDRSTIDLVDKLVSTIPPGATVVLLPLINPANAGEIKSHGMASYLVKYEVLSRAAAHSWTVRDWDRPDRMARDFPHRRNAYVLLIDDFVGTGETANGAWTHFKVTHSVPSDRIYIVCFVAQHVGVEFLARAAIPCITVYERHKGISDSVHLVDKAAAMAVVDRIESDLVIDPNKLRGYMKSEALVMMHRCPDNTFPMYWANQKRSGAAWPRPFRRYE